MLLGNLVIGTVSAVQTAVLQRLGGEQKEMVMGLISLFLHQTSISLCLQKNGIPLTNMAIGKLYPAAAP